jgi:hypothetical protein
VPVDGLSFALVEISVDLPEPEGEDADTGDDEDLSSNGCP